MITEKKARALRANKSLNDHITVATNAIGVAEQALPDRIINFVLLMTESVSSPRPTPVAETSSPTEIIANLLTAVAASVEDGSVVSLSVQSEEKNRMDVAITGHIPSLPPWQRKLNPDSMSALMESQVALVREELDQAGGSLHIGLTEYAGVNIQASLRI